MTFLVVAALLCAAPAKRDKPHRPVIRNVEGDGEAVVTHSQDGRRPLVVRREKPLGEKVADALRDARNRVDEEAHKAGDAISKLVKKWR